MNESEYQHLFLTFHMVLITYQEVVHSLSLIDSEFITEIFFLPLNFQHVLLNSYPQA